MRRVQVIIQHLASEEAAPDAHAEQAAVPDAKAQARENAQRFMAVGMEYIHSA
jgi:hypothetical protein